MDGELLVPSVLDGTLEVPAPVGWSVADVLARAEFPFELRDRIVVFDEGNLITDYEHTYITHGKRIQIAVVPSGGGGGNSTAKTVISAVAIIAIAIAAPYAAGAILGTSLATVGTASIGTQLAFYGLTAGITMVGTLAVSALIPPPKFSSSVGSRSGTGNSSSPSPESRTYSITGQSNTSQLFGVVPKIYGRHRIYPNLGATPLLDNVGKNSRFTALYDFGLGDLDVTDIRLGDLPIESVDPHLNLMENTDGTDLKLLSKQVAYDQVQYLLEENVPLVVTTKTDCMKATLDLVFSNGLVRYDRSQQRFLHTAGFRVRYRPESGGSWKTVGSANFKGAASFTSKFTNYVEYGYTGGNVGDKGTRWDVVSEQIGSERKEKAVVYRYNRIIYTSRWFRQGNTPTKVKLNNRTYYRGVLRDTYYDNKDDANRSAYELIIQEAEANATTRVQAKTAEPFTVGVKIDFPRTDTWEIEVMRTTPITEDLSSLRDVAHLTTIKSHRSGRVLNLKNNHTMLEMTVTATDKINGVVQNLNAICFSRLRNITNNGWTSKIRTDNPALIALDLLAGESTAYPIKNDQIDFPSWNRLKAYCDRSRTIRVNNRTYTAKRHTWNGVIDTDLTVREAVSAVLSTCSAQMIMTAAGKFGVLIDQTQTVARQLITPANSWNFRGERVFTKVPDAFRVSFIDEEQNWEATECIVYNDGFSASNAKVFEDLPTFGITNYAEAYRYGRYMMAQGMLRSERFTVEMDVENLAVQRGDLVRVQSDVPKFGGLAMRITDVAVDVITVDRPVELATGAYAARRSNGTIYTGLVRAQVDDDQFALTNSQGLRAGDLIVFGDRAPVTRDYIVQGITPGKDLTARLLLVPYVPGLYDVDQEPFPPWDPGFGNDILNQTSIAARITKVDQTLTYVNRDPYRVVTLTWEITSAATSYAGAIVEASLPGQDPITLGTLTNAELQFSHSIDFADEAWFEGQVEYIVTPRNTLGIEGEDGRIFVTLDGYDTIPLPPTNVFLDVRSEEVTLYWTLSASPDVNRYLIRYTPNILTPEWHAAQHLGRLNWDETEFSTGARAGTYILRAENSRGYMSPPVFLRTTIEELPDLNLVATLDEAQTTPKWPGQKIKFTVGTGGQDVYILPVNRLGGVVTNVKAFDSMALPYGVVKLDASTQIVSVEVPGNALDDYLVSHDEWTDGTNDQAVYNVAETVDLGAVYECRVQNKIEALATEPFEYNGTQVLAAPSPMLRAATLPTQLNVLSEDQAEDWGAWLEYRGIDQVDYISSWPDLSSIDPISQGTSQFSEWRKINVGDITARIIQFRIVAEAYRVGLRVLISRALVELDMPDRVWRTNNVVVPSVGTTINFNPAFRVTPILAVTTEGAGLATGYKVDSINRLGVTLHLIDASGSPVDGQVDLAALGYGRERGGSL